MRLNPSNFELKDWHLYNYYLYIICEDEAVAKRVQKLDMPEEDYINHFGKPRMDKVKGKELSSKEVSSSSGNLLMG